MHFASQLLKECVTGRPIPDQPLETNENYNYHRSFNPHHRGLPPKLHGRRCSHT